MSPTKPPEGGSRAQPLKSAIDVPHDIRIPGGFMSVCHEYKITILDGREFRFEWHKVCGPMFIGKTGVPLSRQPGERHPVWVAVELWCKQGHRIDVEGNAIWEPFDEMEGFDVVHLGGRNYRLVPKQF